MVIGTIHIPVYDNDFKFDKLSLECQELKRMGDFKFKYLCAGVIVNMLNSVIEWIV